LQGQSSDCFDETSLRITSAQNTVISLITSTTNSCSKLAGETFRYTENGPGGLAIAKKAYIVLASGSVYSTGAAAPLNHAIPYLKSVLAFIGITDVETIYVEGLAFGEEAAKKAVDDALEANSQLTLAALINWRGGALPAHLDDTSAWDEHGDTPVRIIRHDRHSSH
jgi:hypothetical protein